MSQVLAAAIASGAALCFALASVCQHHDASRDALRQTTDKQPRDRLGRVTDNQWGNHTGDTRPDEAVLRWRLALRLLARPVWLLGAVAGVGGVLLQGVALAWGLLIVVQPVLVSGLLFALPLEALIDGRRPPWAQWGWAGFMVSGLALFLIATRPHSGDGMLHHTRLLVGSTLILTLCAVLLVVARRRGPRYRALLLGLVAGAGLGLSAVLGKYCLTLLHHGLVALLVSWPLWLLLPTAAASLMVTQAGFAAGPLVASLPPLTLLDPLIGVALGVLAFPETVATSPLALTGDLLGAAMITLGVIKLARHTAAPHVGTDTKLVPAQRSDTTCPEMATRGPSHAP
ncbi:MAG: DMT family transporter [Sciscionella sp.]